MRIRALLLVLALLLVAGSAHAAALEHTCVEQNTQQTTTSTSFVDVSGASIASGSFTTGKKYLLWVSAHASNSAATATTFVQTLHGTTAFGDSLEGFENSAIDVYDSYSWFDVWTAVSGEGVKLQFRVTSSTGRLDQISLCAFNLSDNLTENTDWFYAQRSTDDALTTTFLDGASITFTPGTASHTWLVAAFAQLDPSAAVEMQTRLDRSGEDISTTPLATLDAADTTNSQPILTVVRCFTLGTASNTFKEQSASVGSNAHTRLHSKVFALNLSKFRNHTCVYTDAAENLDVTDYGDALQTASLTPDVAGDVWIGAYWTFEMAASGRFGEFRVQVDNADQPAGQTADNYSFAVDTSGSLVDLPLGLSTLVNLTAAAHTIDLDGSVNLSTSVPKGRHRLLWGVTMELPAVAGQARGGLLLRGVGP